MRSYSFVTATIALALMAAACGSSSEADAPSGGSAASQTESTTPTPDPTEAPDSLDGEEVGPVQVTGDSLPSTDEGGLLTDPAADPAIGEIAPILSGTNFNGSEVTIGPDGRAKAVYFLAHWCSHCQTEVKLINDLAADGKQPTDVDFYAVAIAVRDDADNYPPSAWLADFPGTVMRDSSENEAAIASGVSGIPYALYLDGESRVMSRSVGSLSRDQVLSQWASLAP